MRWTVAPAAVLLAAAFGACNGGDGGSSTATAPGPTATTETAAESTPAGADELLAILRGVNAQEYALGCLGLGMVLDEEGQRALVADLGLAQGGWDYEVIDPAGTLIVSNKATAGTGVQEFEQRTVAIGDEAFVCFVPKP